SCAKERGAVGHAAHAAADGERDRESLGDACDECKQGRASLERRFHVEEDQLVGAGVGADRAELHRIAPAAAVFRADALEHRSAPSLRWSASWSPRQMPSVGAPPATRAGSASSSPRSRSTAIALAAEPTPGRTARSAQATASAVSAMQTSAPSRAKAARTELT